MLQELGHELRAARKRKDLTLQEVAEPAKISLTYLQKLERGSVNSPSPRVLKRLADVLDISYRRLMELAAYLVPEPSPYPHIPEELADKRLSEAEWRAVLAFVGYLEAQRRC